MMTGHLLTKKSYQFSKKVIALSAELDASHKYTLSNQILKSATSVGANIAESKFAESRKDFIHKYSISLKEANESLYWLKLLSDTMTLDTNMKDLIADIKEIISILAASIKKLKRKI